MLLKQWHIPEHVLIDTENAFKSKNNEVFALWTSSNTKSLNNICKVLRSIIPIQDAHESDDGIFVHIYGSELSRINLDNFKKNEMNVIQLHTHPTSNVNMSSLDIEWEVVNHIGALSIIVPCYGRLGLKRFDDVNVYEREEYGWRLWDKHELDRLVVL